MNETIETTAVSVRPAMSVGQALGVDEILAQVTLIQQVMRKVMSEGEHYGKVPGCGDKLTLLQPGAQKLTMTFRLAPEYEIQEVNLDRGHKEYRVTCTLKSIQSGTFVGQGVGCCSTMESKYRWRQGSRHCPECGKDTIFKDKNGPGYYCWSKKGGCGVQFKDPDSIKAIESQDTESHENDNPADCYNTVLKMAKKRAFVDATITATAASDIFTQDVGDEESDSQQTSSGDDTRQSRNLSVKTELSQTGSTPVAGPGPTNEVGKPGDDPNWFWGVICPIPRKGIKRDEYLRKPETILDLYNFTKQGDDSAQKRLYGFANKWTPADREWKGKIYPPSEAELTFRKALDAFLEWEKEKKAKEGVLKAEAELSLQPEPHTMSDDDVPF